MTGFHTTGLSRELLNAVEQLGFTSPTPIQEQAIPIILQQENDLVALAATGTGKTAAFGLPILDLIDMNQRAIQALIICPTRELARQIHSDFDSFSTDKSGMGICAVYGGASIQNQIRDLQRGVRVVVGTPGRLSDLIQRGVLDLSAVKHLVLDEADEMLNMGFKEDIEYILNETPQERFTYLFSATMPAEVRRIGHNYLKNAVEIAVKKRADDVSGIEHLYSGIQASDRLPALMRLLDSQPNAYAIVFCRTRKDTQQVGDALSQAGYPADCLHGDLSQAQRDQVMKRFRTKRITVLVATDVAARGIDVDDVTHVVHYHIPDDLEAYVHRSGRTARAGKSGISIAFATIRDKSRLKDLSRIIGKEIKPFHLPSGEEVCTIRLQQELKSITELEPDMNQVNHMREQMAELIPDLSEKDLADRLLYKALHDLYDRYAKAPDLNLELYLGKNSRDAGSKKKNKSDRDERKHQSQASSFTRFYINVGKKDDVNPNRLMGFINEQNELKGSAIGRIEILKTFSFFELDSSLTDLAMEELNGQTFRGRKISLSLAEAPTKPVARKKLKGVSFGDRDRGKTNFKKPRHKGKSRKRY